MLMGAVIKRQVEEERKGRGSDFISLLLFLFMRSFSKNNILILNMKIMNIV